MASKKKVLVFTPGGVGGAERMSVLIGKILPKECFVVKYVVIGCLKGIYNLIPDGYEVDCIPVRNIYAFSTLRIWLKLIREKPDIVFTSQEAYNGRVIMASKIAGCKVLARSSNMIGKYKKRLLRQVKFTYPQANLLIAQQEEMREEMIKLLGIAPERVVTIHNPIDREHIDNLSTVPSPYHDNGVINYVNTANVSPRKGQDIAIKAFSIVKKSMPNAHLYFVGSYNENDEYYKNLQSIILSEGLVECVHFVGYDKNPFKWVKYANCFVFPSRIEGLPNALIEATYLRVPCVATRCLKIVDSIISDGQNGYVVEKDDALGLAEAMKNAIVLKPHEMVYSPGSTEDIVHLFESI